MNVQNKIKKQLSNKKSQSGCNISLLFSVLFLTGIGIVMIYSASFALALKKFGSEYYFLKKQYKPKYPILSLLCQSNGLNASICQGCVSLYCLSCHQKLMLTFFQKSLSLKPNSLKYLKVTVSQVCMCL